jgi:hypothetical protein
MTELQLKILDCQQTLRYYRNNLKAMRYNLSLRDLQKRKIMSLVRIIKTLEKQHIHATTYQTT